MADRDGPYDIDDLHAEAFVVCTSDCAGYLLQSGETGLIEVRFRSA